MRYFFSCIVAGSLLLASFVFKAQTWPDDTPVWNVLVALGVERPDHFVETTPRLIRQGEEIVKHGRTTLQDGSKSSYISKYYTCTSCHNVVREDPDLSVVDQEARLNYSIKKQIPYLQGSTFWGIVNRKTWYNDDYVLKYGDLVKDAKNSLKGSIELCATVCSQGRSLEDWEMNSILAYMWSLQIKMNDLDFTSDEIDSYNSKSEEEKIALIQSKYLDKSPATFGEPPKNKAIGYAELTGRPEKGKAIFELGCQHCHRPKGESEVIFTTGELTLNWLKKHKADKGDLSFYEIIRKGTYSEYGHKEYMPHYTIEKMSDQQVEDLRTFIEGSSL